MARKGWKEEIIDQNPQEHWGEPNMAPPLFDSESGFENPNLQAPIEQKFGFNWDIDVFPCNQSQNFN